MYMSKRFFVIIGFCSLAIISCGQQQHSTAATETETRAIAFPGAEGFGKYATGGRGGKVYIVTNLNDNGPGSFREAAEANEPRIIVFAVSGTIHLDNTVSIKGNATIAGQSAPGDGICVADKSVQVAGDNIVVRYMRFRLGDKWQRQKGMVDGSGGEDAFGGNRRNHVIIDHCTFSWSNDECFSIYGGDSTTFQWNLISEPLNYSYHFEEGDKDYEKHGYGGIWGGTHLSAHHNLFAHCVSRNPRFNGARLGASKEFVDYRNNVIYNWGGNNVYGGEAGVYNIVNNYYRYGPSTNKAVRYRIVNPSKTETIPFGKYYVAGNYVDESVEVTQNNYLGIDMGNGATEADKRAAVQDKEFETVMINPQTAVQAYESVLKEAGASFRRDTLDQRIINDVRNRTGKFIDVQGGYPHGSPLEATLNAWPTLKSASAPVDSDKDGMPDEWEKKNKLDPQNASDAAAYKLNKYFTNVEVYLNSLIK